MGFKASGVGFRVPMFSTALRSERGRARRPGFSFRSPLASSNSLVSASPPSKHSTGLFHHLPECGGGAGRRWRGRIFWVDPQRSSLRRRSPRPSKIGSTLNPKPVNQRSSLRRRPPRPSKTRARISSLSLSLAVSLLSLASLSFSSLSFSLFLFSVVLSAQLVHSGPCKVPTIEKSRA